MRPLTLTISTWIMAVFVASDWYVTYWHHSARSSAVLGLLIDAAVGYLVLRAYWQGHNWVRKLVLVFSFLIALGGFVGVLAIFLSERLKAQFTPQYLRHNEALGWAHLVFAVYMLFYLNSTEARTFFGSQSQERPSAPQPERTT